MSKEATEGASPVYTGIVDRLYEFADSAVNYPDPRLTLELLEALEPLGFDDRAFAILHHRHGNIPDHRLYCQQRARFNLDSNNVLVQRRLELVLAAYRGGGFSTGSNEVFQKLAEASVAEIPFANGN